MTRSPKMTGTRPRRNRRREPDIATASDTNPDRSVPSSLSLFLQSSCLPANMPACQHTLHSINSGPTPHLRNDAEIKSIPRHPLHPLIQRFFPCVFFLSLSPSLSLSLSRSLALPLFSMTNASNRMRINIKALRVV